MSKHSGSGKFGWIGRTNRKSTFGGGKTRKLAFESLEIRQLLSVSAPTSLALAAGAQPGTQTLTSANNSSAAEQLSFLVSGVTAGNTVKLYVDGGTTPLVSGTVQTGQTTITLTTTANSSSPFSNGSHTFTATQTDTSSNVSPATSDTIQIFNGLTATITSSRATTATVGSAFSYVYTVTTNTLPTGDTVTYSLPSTSAPSGMTFNATTKTATWTPATSDAGTTQSFTLSGTDTAGNTVTLLPVFASVAAAGAITIVSPPANVAINSPVLVGFSDTTSGTPHYTVTTSSTADLTGAHLTGTILTQTNPVLKIVTDQGEMDFQLLNNYTPNTVAQIESLVAAGVYNPSTYTSFTGTFALNVGTTTTAAITFNAADPTTTAANIQAALRAAGFSGATVTYNSSAAFPAFSFNVTFSSAESPITYTAGTTHMPVSFSNSASSSTTAVASQTLTFTTAVPEFYRIISTFMNQGGVSGLANVSDIPVELNSNLRFTSSGLLAMANNGVDGNSSEFFVTNPDDMSNGFLDFRYTIFGKLISGDAVRAAIATTPVTTNTSSGENSQPLTPPKILSMSVVQQTSGGGVLQLNAASQASGPYTVTVSDGLGGTQSFTINIGTNSFDPPNPWVNAINGSDKINATSGTATPFTFTTGSADGSAVQVSVQTMLSIPAISGAYVDSSFLNSTTESTYPATNPNTNITLTQTGTNSYTVTPKAGFYGVQVLEVMGFTPVTTTSPATSGHGTFQLQVGSTTTAAINFDSTNLTTTAANIQTALRNAGFNNATVKVDQGTTAPNFVFDVTFASSQSDISMPSGTNGLPLTFSNAATSAAASQRITFAATGASWDSGSGVNPVYRAFVPVYVAPAAPVLSSISAGGKTITGSTFYNNGDASTELTFNVTGVISGATIGVFVDGGSTPLVSGVASSTSISLTTTGGSANKISDGAHTFTVKEIIATQALTLYADWSASGGPASQFGIPAGSAQSTSAGTTLTIGLYVLTTPVTKAREAAVYTYVVQTNAPAGDAITVTPVTMPAGMTFDNAATFTWTPSASQLNNSFTFEAQVSDSQGRTITIGPVDITVTLGLTPTQVPVNPASGGNVTVSFSGGNVVVYDNIAKTSLSSQSFKSTDAVEIDLPAGQANAVAVNLPSSGAIPYEVYVTGAAGATNNQVIVNGTAGNDSFAVDQDMVTTTNGLLVAYPAAQKVTLAGNGGNNYYSLWSSAVPLTITNTSGQGTLDFSRSAAGVAVSLGLYRGQAQPIWGTTLSLNGVLSEIIGSRYADALTGGPAATTIIHSGTGNDRIVGGSGNNILVGGGGADTITGGSNKNVIIGGSGNSTLYARGNSNTVVAGSTNYDANDAALMNLLNQGPLFVYGYSMRRALASAARNAALTSTMFNTLTWAHDTIFGSGPNNWFVPGPYGVVKP